MNTALSGSPSYLRLCRRSLIRNLVRFILHYAVTRYHWLVQHKENLQLGYQTDIGVFTYINAKYGVIIEDYVQIGSHCSIYSVSTIDMKKGPVVLKKNSRVGAHSVIMPGVTVGQNAVVGAMSFVNRDVPDNAVVVGAPARRIK